MTPYGALLRYYRELRGYSQVEFASKLGIANKTLSAVETGRRGPHDKITIDRIKAILSLSELEYSQLLTAADHSSLVIRIPNDTAPERIVLVHRLVSSLALLQHDQIMMICTVLQGRQAEMF